MTTNVLSTDNNPSSEELFTCTAKSMLAEKNFIVIAYVGSHLYVNRRMFS